MTTTFMRAKVLDEVWLVPAALATPEFINAVAKLNERNGETSVWVKFSEAEIQALRAAGIDKDTWR